LGGIVRIGLVGYGVGGRYFHAPFIQAAKGCELAGVVTRSPQRRAEVHQDLPGVPIFASLGELLDAGVDAVTISTPPQTRRELVLEAADRRVNVIADKPFAPTAAAGQDLVDTAAAAGVLLSVFHNRRWDTDITTLRGVLDQPAGRCVAIRLTLRSRSGTDPRGRARRRTAARSGQPPRRQALWLLGPARLVSANLDWVELPEGRTDAGFVITLVHASGAHSHTSSSKLNRLESRELRVLGAKGSYVSSQTDVQAQAIFAGLAPSRRPERLGL
jgi:predicted dehydrogenase